MKSVSRTRAFICAVSSLGTIGVTIGAADKLGVYWSDRPHGFGETDWDGLLAFADKHLLGKRVSRAFDLFPTTDEVATPALRN